MTNRKIGDGFSPRPDALAFTIKDVQRVGGPSRSQVYKLALLGKLKLVKVGGRTFVEGDSLRSLLRGGE